MEINVNEVNVETNINKIATESTSMRTKNNISRSYAKALSIKSEKETSINLALKNNNK